MTNPANPTDLSRPTPQIRARQTPTTVTVYQAYPPPSIALPAARDQHFPAAWKRDRMTWIIKPLSQTPARRPVLVHDRPVTPETQRCRMSERRVGGSGG